MTYIVIFLVNKLLLKLKVEESCVMQRQPKLQTRE